MQAEAQATARPFGKRVALSLLTLGLVVGLLEGGIRLAHVVRDRVRGPKVSTTNSAGLFEPNAYLAYVANPSNPEHTRDGFRSPHEVSLAHEGWRILCLGGSSTYGTRVREADSYPRQLERALAEDASPAPEVLNGGLGGWSTPNLIGFLALRALDYRPDICLFYVGFNDAWNRLLYADSRADNSNAQRPWSLPSDVWRHSMVLNLLRFGRTDPDSLHIHKICWNEESGDPEENWRASSFAPFRRNLRTLVAICRANSIRPILCTQATDFEHHPTAERVELWARAMEETTREVRAAAEELEVDLIDLRTPMSNQEAWFADCLHMNEAGNRERARLIAEWMRERNCLAGPARRR